MTMGIAVLPQNNDNAALSQIYSTDQLGVDVWKKFEPHLNMIQQYMMARLSYAYTGCRQSS